MLTLFMNTKCHQLPFHQIISGDRTTLWDYGECWYMCDLNLPSPPHTGSSIYHTGSMSNFFLWEGSRCKRSRFKSHCKSQSRSLYRDVKCTWHRVGLCSVKLFRNPTAFFLFKILCLSIPLEDNYQREIN